jgi:hypothetical protein
MEDILKNQVQAIQFEKNGNISEPTDEIESDLRADGKLYQLAAGELQ